MANAYNVLRQSLFDAQLVRTIALWDACKKNKFDMISIPTVVNLLDADTVKLAKEQNLAISIARENDGFYEEMATKSNARCDTAIVLAQQLSESEKLKSLRNFRNKHLAHNLIKTYVEEKMTEPLAPLKNKDVRELLNEAIKFISALHSCLNQTHFDFDGAEDFAAKNADELWNRFKFT